MENDAEPYAVMVSVFCALFAFDCWDDAKYLRAGDDMAREHFRVVDAEARSCTLEGYYCMFIQSRADEICSLRQSIVDCHVNEDLSGYTWTDNLTQVGRCATTMNTAPATSHRNHCTRNRESEMSEPRVAISTVPDLC